MNKKIIIMVIIVAVAIVGGYFLLKQNNPTSVSEQSSAPQQLNTSPESQNNQTQTKNGVVYTDAGFSPAELTIKVGDTVTFVNQSSGGMWVGSAMHPSHTVYSGTTLQQHCPDPANTSFDECQSDGPGTLWSFAFTKVGTWGYHNHVNAKHFGKIIVE